MHRPPDKGANLSKNCQDHNIKLKWEYRKQRENLQNASFNNAYFWKAWRYFVAVDFDTDSKKLFNFYV